MITKKWKKKALHSGGLQNGAACSDQSDVGLYSADFRWKLKLILVSLVANEQRGNASAEN